MTPKRAELPPPSRVLVKQLLDLCPSVEDSRLPPIGEQLNRELVIDPAHEVLVLVARGGQAILDLAYCRLGRLSQLGADAMPGGLVVAWATVRSPDP
jgi:hypothetical protein